MIKFGTDGWRAVIADDFTYSNVRIVAQAISDYTKADKLKRGAKGKKPSLIVGYDCRFLSDKYAEIISEVLAANNIKTLLTKSLIPTPALSFAVKKLGLSGGIMVTASHNPPKFNGIKFKTSLGCSADLRITRKIESYIGKNKIKSLDIEEARRRKLVKVIDILPSYKKNIRNFLDLKILKKSRIKVVIDNMHGVCDSIILDILKDTNIKVTILNQAPLVNFGGICPEPIKQNLTELIKLIKKGKFNLGLAVDGDGDRLTAVTSDGKFVNSSQIFALLILYFLQFRKEKGAIAKTVSSSSLIDRIAKKYNLNLKETPIGFKYLADLMIKKIIIMAGEESGGIGITNYLPDRDATLISLLLIEMLAKTKKSLNKLLKEIDADFGKLYYQRRDMEVSQNARKALIFKLKNAPFKSICQKRVKEVKRLDGVKFILENDSWLLYRFSGTEPLLRIYVESSSKELASKILNFAIKTVQELD